MERIMLSTNELLNFFENTPDLVFLLNKEEQIVKNNPAVSATLSFSNEELQQLNISYLQHPEDLENNTQNCARRDPTRTFQNCQSRFISKNGDVIWLDWTSIYFPENELILILARNITTIKLAEIHTEQQYQKYKGLAEHFKSSIEKDRKYLAYELHEELAQLAAGIKIELETIPFHVNNLPIEATQKINTAASNTNLLIKTLQRLSFSISPSMLGDIGLEATLKWLCKEFQILTGQQCEFESSFIEDHLSLELKTDFFRICQEALDNIMHHAQATQTMISVSEENKTVTLLIQDNGNGFNHLVQHNGDGITNMYKLVTSIGGQIDITSSEANGTKVCVRIGL